MGNAYMKDLYWISLEYVVEEILAER